MASSRLVEFRQGDRVGAPVRLCDLFRLLLAPAHRHFQRHSSFPIIAVGAPSSDATLDIHPRASRICPQRPEPADVPSRPFLRTWGLVLLSGNFCLEVAAFLLTDIAARD